MIGTTRSRIATVALALVLAIGIAEWTADFESPFEGGPDPASSEALEVIESSYWRDVDSRKLQDAAVQAMVEQLRKRYDDRFSHYLDPELFREFRAASEGEFSGIGLAVTGIRQGLRVAQVYEGTPAERAGIEEGDLIVAVEGRSIAGESAEASTARIKGPPGTEVTIVVRTPGEGSRELTVERARVKIPAVRGEIRRAGGRRLGYVQLANFTDGVHGELRSEVERLARRGAGGFVLDLRGNGGGLLSEAVLTASVFVEDGAIVSTEGRASPQKTYDAVGDALPERPMAVLIDRDTASAAEILAAALSDYGLATLVGTRSFGKGTFQEVIPLSSGGGLDLTVGEYVTSEGKSLAGRGISPDVRVRDARRTRPDVALRRALAIVAGELAKP